MQQIHSICLQPAAAVHVWYFTKVPILTRKLRLVPFGPHLLKHLAIGPFLNQLYFQFDENMKGVPTKET